ncbi:MAG: hypothetical protein ABGW65_05410 [Marinoscillum sp.]
MQGAVVRNIVSILIVLLHWSNAFCSACVAMQESRFFPDSESCPPQGVLMQWGNPRGTPL